MKEYKFKQDDIDKIIKTMVILIDTAEKKNEHITKYLDKYNIKYKKDKLNFCDYSFMIPKNSEFKIENDMYFHTDIAIERKASFDELSGNLAQERERFERELLKGTVAKCKMFLLIENPAGYDGILKHQYSTNLTPLSYYASLRSFEQKYNLHINFVLKDRMPFHICNIFKYFLREYFK